MAPLGLRVDTNASCTSAGNGECHRMECKLELVVARNQTPPIPDLAALKAPSAVGMLGRISDRLGVRREPRWRARYSKSSS
jgi:hypothetical protein